MRFLDSFYCFFSLLFSNAFETFSSKICGTIRIQWINDSAGIEDEEEMNPFVIILLHSIICYPFSASLSGWQQSYHQPNSVFFNKFQQRHFSLVILRLEWLFVKVKNKKQYPQKSRNPWSYGLPFSNVFTFFFCLQLSLN